jgi:hypothetical protein
VAKHNLRIDDPGEQVAIFKTPKNLCNVGWIEPKLSTKSGLIDTRPAD